MIFMPFLFFFPLEPGSSLGIGLGGTNSLAQIQGIFVRCIIEGTPAANDGRLRWNVCFDCGKYKVNIMEWQLAERH